MALELTQVHRNLHQRVTWLYLEIEDMFLVLGLGVLANFIGRFLGREIYGIPLSFLLLWIVPILSIPCLWLFKYGKPGAICGIFCCGRSSLISIAVSNETAN